MTNAIEKLEVLAAVLAVLQVGSAQTRTWTSGVSGLWSDPTKWTPNGTPVAGDQVSFGTAVSADTTVTIGTAPSVSFGNVVVTDGGELVFQGKSDTERSLTIANSAADLMLTGGPWVFEDMDAIFKISYASNPRLLMTGGTGSTVPTELVLAGNSKVTFSGTKLLMSGDNNARGSRVTVKDMSSLIVSGTNAELQPGRGQNTWGGIVQQGGVVQSDVDVSFGYNQNSFGTWETFGGAVTNTAKTKLAVGTGSAGAWYVHGGVVRMAGEPHLGVSGRAELFVDGGTLDFSGMRIVSRASDSDATERPAVFTVAGHALATGYSVMPYGEYNDSYTGHSRAMVNLNDSATLSLSGGFRVRAAGSTRATLSFNGGTLERVTSSQDSDENKSLLSGVDTVVYPKGGKLKARKSDGSPSSMLLNSARFRKAGGFGVQSIAVTSGGSGYLLPPLVDIRGGSGSNATAVAQVDYETGAVTNVVVTCPGEGYAADDVLDVAFVVPSKPVITAAQAAVTLAENTAGALSVVDNTGIILGADFSYDGDVAVQTGSTLKYKGHVAFGGTSSLNMAWVLDDGALTLTGPAQATGLDVTSKGTLVLGGSGTLAVSGNASIRGKLVVDRVSDAPIMTVAGMELNFSENTSTIEVGPSVPTGGNPIVVAKTTGALNGKPKISASSAEHWRVRVVETADGKCLMLQPKKGVVLVVR